MRSSWIQTSTASREVVEGHIVNGLGATGDSCIIRGHQWNTDVPPVLAGGHPDRCKLLLAGRQQPSTAGTAVFRSMSRRSHPMESDGAEVAVFRGTYDGFREGRIPTNSGMDRPDPYTHFAPIEFSAPKRFLSDR